MGLAFGFSMETSMPFDPVVRTRMLARIVGPYLVIVAVALFARLDTLHLLFPAFMQDGPLVFVTGAFALMAGLVVVAFHHHWDTSAAIAISLIGFAAALKGAMLMIAPTLGSAMTVVFVQSAPVMLIAIVFELVAGLWLSYVGWFQK